MSVYKRKGSDYWQYEFELNGQRYRGSTGETSKQEALRYELRMRDQAKEDAENARRGVKHLTLEEALRGYLATAQVELADYSTQEGIARKILGRTLVDGKVVEGSRWGLSPTMKLHELCQSDLVDLKDERRKEGNSLATINRELSCLQSMLRWAKERKVVVPQDLSFSSVKTKEKAGKLRYLTMEEEVRLLEALREKYAKTKTVHAKDQYDLVVFWLDTGCRYNEATSLTWDVIDFERNTVNLYRHKVGNESDLVLTDRLREILEARLVATEGRRYIFPGGRGKKWSNEDVPRGYSPHSIRETMDEVGLNDPILVKRFGTATIHTFRDTFATRLAQEGMSLYQLQCLLGHSTPAMTQKYAKLLHKDVSQEASSILNRLHKAAAIKCPHNRAPMPDDVRV